MESQFDAPVSFMENPRLYSDMASGITRPTQLFWAELSFKKIANKLHNVALSSLRAPKNYAPSDEGKQLE